MKGLNLRWLLEGELVVVLVVLWYKLLHFYRFRWGPLILLKLLIVYLLLTIVLLLVMC